MSNQTQHEWRILNTVTSGPGRSHHGAIGYDEPAGAPLFALYDGARMAITGYCEKCDAADYIHNGETLIDLATIADPWDHSNRGTCLRCGHNDATPYYDATESRTKLAEAVASAVFYACAKCHGKGRYYVPCGPGQAQGFTCACPAGDEAREADRICARAPLGSYAEQMNDAGRGRLVRR